MSSTRIEVKNVAKAFLIKIEPAASTVALKGFRLYRISVRRKWPQKDAVQPEVYVLGHDLCRADVSAILAQFRPKARPFDMEVWNEADDAEKVRRAAALLEAYVRKSSVPAGAGFPSISKLLPQSFPPNGRWVAIPAA